MHTYFKLHYDAELLLRRLHDINLFIIRTYSIIIDILKWRTNVNLYDPLSIWFVLILKRFNFIYFLQITDHIKEF